MESGMLVAADDDLRRAAKTYHMRNRLYDFSSKLSWNQVVFMINTNKIMVSVSQAKHVALGCVMFEKKSEVSLDYNERKCIPIYGASSLGPSFFVWC